MDAYQYKQDELAGIVGKSRSHLTNTLRLLKLPGSVQELVRNGALSAGHARALIGHDDAEQLARDIVRREMSVRDVEALIQRRGKTKSAHASKSSHKDADTRAAERELSDALGLSVSLVSGKGEKGEVRIAYSSLEQFEDVRRKLLK